MRYFLFLDESGDHGLKNIDENFPVFTLCGVLVKESDYFEIREKMNDLKESFWKNKNVILHSRDIRKCEEEFNILFDLDIKKEFYSQLNKIVKDSSYKIITATVKKDEFIKKYGKQSDNIYGIALSFIVERTVYCLDQNNKGIANVQIVIEKRGRKEDKVLEDQFQLIKDNGTYYVSAQRIQKYGFGFHFRSKTKNINGLQLADLIAYPIARYIINPHKPHPSFILFKDKIYGDDQQFGLKIFP